MLFRNMEERLENAIFIMNELYKIPGLEESLLGEERHSYMFCKQVSHCCPFPHVGHIAFWAHHFWHNKPKKVKKLALNSQLLTVQILTNMFWCSFCVVLILLLLQTGLFGRLLYQSTLKLKVEVPDFNVRNANDLF